MNSLNSQYNQISSVFISILLSYYPTSIIIFSRTQKKYKVTKQAIKSERDYAFDPYKDVKFKSINTLTRPEWWCPHWCEWSTKNICQLTCLDVIKVCDYNNSTTISTGNYKKNKKLCQLPDQRYPVFLENPCNINLLFSSHSTYFY